MQNNPQDSTIKFNVPARMRDGTILRGYVVVVPDTRGRFASAGQWYPYRAEADDGVDTIARPRKVRRKRDFGRRYRKAGWKEVGRSKDGLVCLQILPHEMPEPEGPLGVQLELGEVA